MILSLLFGSQSPRCFSRSGLDQDVLDVRRRDGLHDCAEPSGFVDHFFAGYPRLRAGGGPRNLTALLTSHPSFCPAPKGDLYCHVAQTARTLTRAISPYPAMIWSSVCKVSLGPISITARSLGISCKTRTTGKRSKATCHRCQRPSRRQISGMTDNSI